MKTKGRRTIIESLDVEVDAVAVLDTIYAESIPIGFDFLGSDGHWYKPDGFNYHNREDLYEKDRQATPEELEFKKAYRLMRNFVKDHNL